MSFYTLQFKWKWYLIFENKITLDLNLFQLWSHTLWKRWQFFWMRSLLSNRRLQSWSLKKMRFSTLILSGSISSSLILPHKLGDEKGEIDNVLLSNAFPPLHMLSKISPVQYLGKTFLCLPSLCLVQEGSRPSTFLSEDRSDWCAKSQMHCETTWNKIDKIPARCST